MLETKINELTKAIVTLTERLDALLQPQVVAAPTPADTEAPEAVKVVEPEPTPEPAKETAPATTADDLRDMCLALTRADRSNKDKIKALMADKYDAKVVKDIEPAKYDEFKLDLESL